MDYLTVASLTALGQVILIDLVLAGDNAVVIGMAAAGLEKHQRLRAVTIGIAVATILRIVFAGLAMQLLEIVGLTLAGGLLLLWVCWKMWGELREQPAFAVAGAEENIARQHKTLGQAILQIIVADVSMSIDNVLAVAGAAREHLWVLVVGLVVSVGLMGIAASMIARLLERYRWIAYVGLAIIVFVALRMIFEGTLEVAPAIV